MEEVSQKWGDLTRKSNLPVSKVTQKKQMENIYNFLKQSFTSPTIGPIVEKLNKEFAKKKLPAQIKQVVDEEISNLQDLPEQHPEFQTKRNFLELLA